MLSRSGLDAPRCWNCAKDFHLFRRRKNCEGCSGVFCNECTPFKTQSSGGRLCSVCAKDPAPETQSARWREQDFRGWLKDAVSGTSVYVCLGLHTLGWYETVHHAYAHAEPVGQMKLGVGVGCWITSTKTGYQLCISPKAGADGLVLAEEAAEDSQLHLLHNTLLEELVAHQPGFECHQQYRRVRVPVPAEGRRYSVHELTQGYHLEGALLIQHDGKCQKLGVVLTDELLELYTIELSHGLEQHSSVSTLQLLQILCIDNTSDHLLPAGFPLRFVIRPASNDIDCLSPAAQARVAEISASPARSSLLAPLDPSIPLNESYPQSSAEIVAYFGSRSERSLFEHAIQANCRRQRTAMAEVGASLRSIEKAEREMRRSLRQTVAFGEVVVQLPASQRWWEGAKLYTQAPDMPLMVLPHVQLLKRVAGRGSTEYDNTPSSPTHTVGECVAGVLIATSTELQFNPTDTAIPQERMEHCRISRVYLKPRGEHTVGLQVGFEFGAVSWWWCDIGPAPNCIHLQALLVTLIQQQRARSANPAATNLNRALSAPSVGRGAVDQARASVFRAQFMIPATLQLSFEAAAMLTLDNDGMCFLGWISAWSDEADGCVLVCFMSQTSDLLDRTCSCLFRLSPGELTGLTKTPKGARLEACRTLWQNSERRPAILHVDLCASPGLLPEQLALSRSTFQDLLRSLQHRSIGCHDQSIGCHDQSREIAERGTCGEEDGTWESWHGLPDLIKSMKTAEGGGGQLEEALALDWLPDGWTPSEVSPPVKGKAKWVKAKSLFSQRKNLTQAVKLAQRETKVLNSADAVLHDRYGFELTSSGSSSLHEVHLRERSLWVHGGALWRRQVEGLERWRSYLNSYALPAHPPSQLCENRMVVITHELTEMVTVGQLPTIGRPLVWTELTNATIKQQSAPAGFYQSAVRAATGDRSILPVTLQTDLTQVDDDIERSLPNLCQHSLLPPIHRILYAFSSRAPYEQGMHFVAQRLICILPEEQAFWVLCAFYEDLFPGHDESKQYGKHALKVLVMDLIGRFLPQFFDLLTGADLEVCPEHQESWSFNKTEFQSRVVENWANNFFLSFGTVMTPTEPLWLIWDMLIVIGPHMFVPIALALVSLSLGLSRQPSVQARLASHQDPVDRLLYVIHDMMAGVCELLHDPADLLNEIPKWSQRPELHKSALQTAKKGQMELMQSRALMCAAARKAGDGLQVKSREPDGRALCEFCAKTFDGGNLGSPCCEDATEAWFAVHETSAAVPPLLNHLITLDGVARTPLQVGIDAGNENFVERMLARFAVHLDLEVKQQPAGRTALMKCMWDPHAWKLVPSLIHAGAKVVVLDSAGYSPLHVAALTAMPKELVGVLLSGLCETEMDELMGLRTVADYPALLLAAEHGHHQLCALLLEEEVPSGWLAAPRSDVNQVIQHGQLTAMHLAVSRGHLKVCEALLRHSAYSHIRAADGWLPHHVAAYTGKDEVLLTLLTHLKESELFTEAIEQTVKIGGEERTALEIAERRNHISCCEVLRTFTNLRHHPARKHTLALALKDELECSEAAYDENEPRRVSIELIREPQV